MAACDVSPATITNVRTRFLRGGLDEVLSDKRQERRRQALTSAQQAHLIAIACSDAPAGHDHWRLRMLAGKAVELGFVEHIALETIRSLLKRINSNLGRLAGRCGERRPGAQRASGTRSQTTRSGTRHSPRAPSPAFQQHLRHFEAFERSIFPTPERGAQRKREPDTWRDITQSLPELQDTDE